MTASALPNGTLPAVSPSILASVVADLPDGLLLLDENWRITYANRVGCSISRLRPEHFNSLTHWEIFPDSVGSALDHVYRAVMADRVARDLPPYFYEPFSVWLSVRVFPAGDGIAVLYQDITARIRAEEAARHAEASMRLALDAANSVGTWDWDVPNDLVYADEHLAQIYGLDPDLAARGASWSEFTKNIHPEDLEQVRTAVRAALENGGDFTSEYRLRSGDGEFRWVIARGRCTMDSEGKALRFPGIAIDVTDRKRTESALMQTEKLAAVGRMASSIAHEINNPLESVMNLIFVARERAEDDEARHYLDIADRELRRVAVIANETLRFNKQASLPKAALPDDLVHTVLGLYESRLHNAAITVQRRKRARRPITCFEGDIRQVLNNLVGNAIDAMSRGGRLLVRSRECTDWRTGRRGVTLTVADTGGGMNPDARARVFEPFFTTKGFNGTGLGLWVSADIVARHNGRIMVRSSQMPGHTGTVFTVFLPYKSTLTASAATRPS